MKPSIRWNTLLASFAFGLVLGVWPGAMSGATLATSRDRGDCVAIERYRAACEMGAEMASLYEAERRRNVRLLKKHVPATIILSPRNMAR